MEETSLKTVKIAKNYKMTLFLSLLIAIEGTIMTIVNYIEHETFLVIVTASYSVLMLISFFHIYKTKKLYLFYITSYFVIIFLEITFLITGGAEGFGIIWLSLIPLFGLYCLEFKPFYILTIAIYVILLIGFYSPLKIYCYTFTPTFRTRYAIYFFVDLAFIIFLKYRITKTEEDLERERATLSRELNQAGLIQSTFYKMKTSHIKDWKIAYKNVPMAVVTGDLYDFCTTNDQLDGFGIYDISGHGISSGLLTMLLKNIVHQEFYADRECDLWETVNRINDRFVEEKEDVSNYTTGIIARVKGNQLEIVNAAHPAPFLYRKKTNSIEQLLNNPTSKGPIGLKDFPAIYNSQYIDFESGDKLIFYTDGFADCKNEHNELYGDERFYNSISTSMNNDIDSQIAHIFDDLFNFIGKKPQTDDLTVIIIEKN